MYKIFFGDKQIVLTSQANGVSIRESNPLHTTSVVEILEALQEDTSVSPVYFHTLDSNEDALTVFTQKIPKIVAAGGVVKNSCGQILFIYRYKQWDLPKGVLESYEQISDCALREVQEETGIVDLKMLKFRDITYHLFKREGSYFLKETHWFDMYSEHQGDFYPQQEEDIEFVQWVSAEHLTQVLTQTYANIRYLLQKG